MTEVGDRVSDGAGSRGVVIKVERRPIIDTRGITQKWNVDIYVDWLIESR